MKKGTKKSSSPRGSRRLGRSKKNVEAKGTVRSKRSREEKVPRKMKRSGKHEAGKQNQLGRLTVHPRGFGFVRLETGGDDVFIPPKSMHGALHGDRVRVESVKTRKGIDGVVVSVEERWIRRLTGTLRFYRGTYSVEPDFLRLRGPMPVVELSAPGMQGASEDDGETWEDDEDDSSSGSYRAIEEAFDRAKRKRGFRDGRPDEVVVAEIVRYPENYNEVPAVRIVRVLGARGRADVEVEKLKIQEGVEEHFHAAVRAEAERIPSRLRKVDREGREDLRELDLVTIDPPDARDHDDAIFCEKAKDGNYRVVVAIADVAHYVQEGTELDQEAFNRGCSIYLPDRAIPMLPEELSSHMASLVPNKDRLCMAVEAEISPRGKLVKHRIFEGLMRSKAKLSYGGAARALGLSDGPKSESAARARKPMLSLLYELSKVLRKKRMNQGRLDFELPEPRISLNDETREPEDVYRSKSDPGIKEAYRIVEEMMLLANEVVATALVKSRVPTVFRVHGAPQEEKVAGFIKLCEALGERLSLSDAKSPKTLARTVRRLADRPLASVVHYLLLRSLPQAVYDVENIGHFGLGAKNYVHFTSPIRRYPDLLVHRQVKRMLQREKFSKTEKTILQRASVEASRLERRAMTVERSVKDVYRVLLMVSRVGEEFEGTISGVEHFGVYVTLDAPFVDVMLPVERLGHEPFSLDTFGIRLQGERSGVSYALGDKLRIRLEEANLSERRLLGSPTWLPDLDVYALPFDEQVTEERSGEGTKRSQSRKSRRKAPQQGSARSKTKAHGSKEESRDESKGGRRRRRRPITEPGVPIEHASRRRKSRGKGKK